MGLEGVYKRVKKLGGEIVGISSDPPPTVRGTTKGWRLSFPLLPDPAYRVIRLYGVYNPRNRLAHPVTVILDKRGTVRWVFRGKSYVERPDAAVVLREFRKIARRAS